MTTLALPKRIADIAWMHNQRTNEQPIISDDLEEIMQHVRANSQADHGGLIYIACSRVQITETITKPEGDLLESEETRNTYAHPELALRLRRWLYQTLPFFGADVAIGSHGETAIGELPAIGNDTTHQFSASQALFAGSYEPIDLRSRGCVNKVTLSCEGLEPAFCYFPPKL